MSAACITLRTCVYKHCNHVSNNLFCRNPIAIIVIEWVDVLLLHIGLPGLFLKYHTLINLEFDTLCAKQWVLIYIGIAYYDAKIIDPCKVFKLAYKTDNILKTCVSF